MRIFFLFLLLLNVLFAAWQYYRPISAQDAVPPLPAKLQKLVLLNEGYLAAASTARPEARDKMAGGDSPEQIDEQVSCYTLGPFTDLEQVSSIRQEMLAHDSGSEIRTRTEKELHRYWVYLPAASNRADAIETSKALARNKIKDYYIVHGGEHNNRISLGHFREKMHADRRQQQLEKMGYEPTLEPIYRSYDVFWLDYRLTQNKDQADPALAYIADEVSRLDRECE